MDALTMTKLPSMPKARKAKPLHDCACGCGQQTKSTWFPGHDGRATGWAVRILKGLLTLEQVPANEQAGAVIMLARHGVQAEVVPAKARTRRKPKADAVTPAVEDVAVEQVA